MVECRPVAVRCAVCALSRRKRASMKLPKGTNETLKGHRLGAERWLINCRKAAVDGAGCRLLAAKMWHSVPFFMPCHCTWRCEIYVRCWQRECYACTLLLAIFPRWSFVLQNIAVLERQCKSMCHVLSTCGINMPNAKFGSNHEMVRRMLKNACTPVDF